MTKATKYTWFLHCTRYSKTSYLKMANLCNVEFHSWSPNAFSYYSYLIKKNSQLWNFSPLEFWKLKPSCGFTYYWHRETTALPIQCFIGILSITPWSNWIFPSCNNESNESKQSSDTIIGSKSNPEVLNDFLFCTHMSPNMKSYFLNY